MAEPSRPPPPKAYVPLDTKEGASPASLFPNIEETVDEAQPAIPPRPPAYDEHLVEKRKGPPPVPQPYSPNRAPIRGNTERLAGQKDEDSTGSLPPQRRPPPPSRPNRPPSVGAPPSRPSHSAADASDTSLPPPLIPIPSSNPPQTRRATVGAKPNRKGHPEITIVSAEPMSSDSIPSPTVKPTSPQARDVTPPKTFRPGKPKVMPPRPTEAPPPPPPIDDDPPNHQEKIEEKPGKEVPLVRKPLPPRSHAPLPPTSQDTKKKEEAEEVGQPGVAGDGHPSSPTGSPITHQASPRRVKHLPEADSGQKEEKQETEEQKKRPRPPPPRTGPTTIKLSPPSSSKVETKSSPPQPVRSAGSVLTRQAPPPPRTSVAKPPPPRTSVAKPPPPRTSVAKPPPPQTSESTKKEMDTAGKESKPEHVEENVLPMSTQPQAPPCRGSSAASVGKPRPVPAARPVSPSTVAPSQTTNKKGPELSAQQETTVETESATQLASEPLNKEPAQSEPSQPVRVRKPNPSPARPSAGPSRHAQPPARPTGLAPLPSQGHPVESFSGDKMEPLSKDSTEEKADAYHSSKGQQEKEEDGAPVVKPRTGRGPSIKKPPPPRSGKAPTYPAPPPPNDDKHLAEKNTQQDEKEPLKEGKSHNVLETEPSHMDTKEENKESASTLDRGVGKLSEDQSEEKATVIKPRSKPIRPSSMKKPPLPRTGKLPAKPAPPPPAAATTAGGKKPGNGERISGPGSFHQDDDGTELIGSTVNQTVLETTDDKSKSSSPSLKRAPGRPGPAPRKPSKPPARSASPPLPGTTEASTRQAELSMSQTLNDHNLAPKDTSTMKGTRDEPEAIEHGAPEPMSSPKPLKPSRPPQAKPRSQEEKPGKPSGPGRPKPPPPKTVPDGTEAKPRPTKPAPPKPSVPVIADIRKPKLNPDEPPSLPPRPGPGHPLYRYVCSEPHGIALSNKESYDAEELSYQEGDVIELIQKMDDYWYLAYNADTGQEGMILAKGMKIVKNLPGQDIVAGFEEGPCAVATYDFQAGREVELSFSAGDLIMLKARVGDEWLRGQLVDGEEGIFPKSYVEVVEELPADAPVEEFPQFSSLSEDEKPKGPYCVAIETYIAETDEDLTLFASDVIELIERIDDNWLKGRCGRNVGIFPQSFVQIEQDLPPSGMREEALASPDGKADKATSDNLVKALYEFEGQEGELSFAMGESIQVTARVSDEWVYGKKGDKEGMFPTSFVDRIPDNLPLKSNEKEEQAQVTTSPTEKQSVGPATGECEALFDFDTTNVGELRFKCGEIIITTEWIGDDWMYGKIDNREGMFPVNFVKVLKELPKSTDEIVDSLGPPGQRSFKMGDDDTLLPKAVALFDFEAEGDSEISLKKGDTIFLLEKIAGGEWLVGENKRTMKIGQFPANFVDIITPLP